MPWYENRRGESLWYEERGCGFPVVMVHGWCMSSAVWQYQFAGLAASFRVIAPDLRGHGRSNLVAGSLSFSSFANDLADLIEQLNLAKVVLAGWSMGAHIALQACAELSGRLDGMALISATPRFTASADFRYGLAEKEASGMRRKVQRNIGRALVDFYTRIFAEGEMECCPLSSEITKLLESIPPPDTGAVLEALDTLVRADMRHLLPDVHVPTVILNGSHDRICLPQASTYLKEHISGAEQSVFPGCGHAPFLTQSHTFNAELSRFIRSIHA
ncbi:MAG TPA: alpha/beta fold hydrolase [Desulfuromonadales bacterium]|nr:alpha/beta fold hydrolase [Desulfuromonadales bacterium]